MKQNQQINCMIVDDEPIARDILAGYIANTPGLQLLKSCMNATEAYEGLHQHEIDLIFLDIQMPVITGTDFLRSLRNPPLVIFTTAYNQYAVEGFELNSVDYLLKPITYGRFYQAIEKTRERLAYKTSGAPALSQSPEQPGYIFIKQDAKLVRVDHDQINYIEAERDYSSIYLDDKRLFASMHLKIFEDMLPKEKFMRIHRSFIVNLSKIKFIKGNMVEIQANEISIGASYREALMTMLGINA